MEHIWLTKTKHRDIILFFNGWGNDVNPFLHIDTNGFDVLMFYDYKSLDNEDNLIAEIKSYARIHLIAWSFGVWLSQYFCEKYQVKPDYRVAINGTLCPVDDQYGIQNAIVTGTLTQLNERNLMKFQMRMVGGKKAFEKFQAVKPEISWEEQQYELKALAAHFKMPLQYDNGFDKVFIGLQDNIFAPQNQLNFWEGKTRIVQINAPHFCFFQFKTWKEFII